MTLNEQKNLRTALELYPLAKKTPEALVLIKEIFKLQEELAKLEKQVRESLANVDENVKVQYQELLTQFEDRVAELRLLKQGPQGKPGKDYVLTNADKTEIAQQITVPIVEKIIEIQKTEVIKEIPIVTENVVEVAVAESAETIKEKIELTAIIDDLRKEFEQKIQEKLQGRGRGFGGIPGLLTYVGGAKKGFLKGVNFVGATHSVVNGLDTITFSGGSGGGSLFETPAETPDGANTVFTVLHEPDYIIVDGTTLFPDADALGNTPYSYDSGAGQITITNGNPPTLFIKSFYTP